MIKRCYQCRKTMGDLAVMAGQGALELTQYAVDEFEGWAHCHGDDDQFLTLEEANTVSTALGVERETLEGSIVVCFECVKDAMELGRAGR